MGEKSYITGKFEHLSCNYFNTLNAAILPYYLENSRWDWGNYMSHPVDVYVAQRIRKARLMRGMTQATLASQIGCSFQQLQKYEAGQNRVSASRLYEIATALSIEPAYFFDGIGKPVEDQTDSIASRIMFALAKVDNPEVRETLCRMVQSIADTAASGDAEKA